MYAEDAGEQHPWSVLIPQGQVDIRFANSFGAVPLPEALCIDRLSHAASTSFILSPNVRPWKGKMWGVVQASGSDHINIHIEITAGSQIAGDVFLEDIRLGEIRPWSIEYQTSASDVQIGHQAQWTQTVVSPLFPSQLVIERWITEQIQSTPEPPNDPCGATLMAEAIGIDRLPWDISIL